jgi:PAS domain-containing protein
MPGTGREGGRPVPAVLILDAERRVLSATESVARLLGTSPKALVGRTFDELRAELQAIPGALNDIIVRSDVIPGIHLVLLRPPGPRNRDR